MISKTDRRYFYSFQVLRAAALISVYLYHQNIADEVFSRWGVCCFFIMGGFLSAYHRYDIPCENTFLNAVRQGISRIKKIYPLHVIMLIIAFAEFAAGHFEDIMNRILSTVIKLVLNLFLVSDWVIHIPALEEINGEYNIVTWYLSAMLLFYMITPFVIGRMHALYDNKSKYRPYVITGVIFICTIIVNILFICILGRDGAFWYIYEFPVSRIGDYLIGMQLGYICLHTDNNAGAIPKPVFILIVAVNILSILVMLVPACSEYGFLASSGFYFTIPVSVLVMIIALTEDTVVWTKEDHPVLWILIRLGKISPYVYLIHYPVITGVHGVLKHFGDVNIAVWSVLAAVITLAASLAWSLWAGRKK